MPGAGHRGDACARCTNEIPPPRRCARFNYIMVQQTLRLLFSPVDRCRNAIVSMLATIGNNKLKRQFAKRGSIYFWSVGTETRRRDQIERTDVGNGYIYIYTLISFLDSIAPCNCNLFG